ncbi:C-glycoside deglycosidase beta subunit domain-containing protein [Actinoplanes sp. CA-142083]|uniref:C-glycoside deglycosidase beta subunit domain-containing protein n=1 Tax=Actinoplanes sp. CA-142083 TaxID=3239903 RepID=UPI003D91117B
MLDPQMIQTRGFRNTADGFEVRLRLPYYRGVWTNLIVGASITVDDVAAPAAEIRWSIGGVPVALSSETARWPVDVPAVLSVPRAEPLAIGFHTVAAELRLTMSYIPEELQPTVWTEQRRLVITR